MYNQPGSIFNIQRFSTSDGPGIRTVVFLKGCPLNCAWCHNPESKSSLPELFFKESSCIGCGACCQVCSAHHIGNNTHHLHRASCTVCGRCAELCPTGALELCGKTQSVDEVITAVLRDIPFYQTSGGGITLSGGEPLMQYDFSMRLLKEAKNYSIHTAIETSGYSAYDLREIGSYIDLWLYDIKLIDEADHICYTGVSNRSILRNLDVLSRSGASIILRCPIIPDVNMNEAHLTALAELSHLSGVQQLHIEPYHPLGISKSVQLGKAQPYSNEAFLKKDMLQPFVDRLRQKSRAEILVL